MVKYLSFAGNQLENLKNQLEDSGSISKMTGSGMYFEHLNANCDFLQLDLFIGQDLYLFQKPYSALSSPSGLLIYFFDGDQPPSYQLDDVNVETVKRGSLFVSHRQACKIRFSKPYRGFWGVFSVSGAWSSESLPYPYQTLSKCLPLSALSIHYLNQLRRAEISETKRENCARTIILHQLFYQLLLELITRSKQSSSLNSIEQIKYYLLTNLSSPLPAVEKLAQLCNMSVSTFKAKFQQNTGGSAKKFFYEAQMDLANRLLSQGFTIKEIANQLGYANASNFIHAFKRKFGVSPLKYKEEQAVDLLPLSGH